MSEYDLIIAAIDGLKDRFDRFEEKQDTQIDSIYKKLTDEYVTCKEFEPIQKAVYAAIGLIVFAVIGALVTLVIKS